MGGLFVYVCSLPSEFIKLLYSHLYIFNGLIAFSIPKLCYFCIVASHNRRNYWNIPLSNGIIEILSLDYSLIFQKLLLRPFRLPHHIFILYVIIFIDNELLTN